MGTGFTAGHLFSDAASETMKDGSVSQLTAPKTISHKTSGAGLIKPGMFASLRQDLKPEFKAVSNRAPMKTAPKIFGEVMKLRDLADADITEPNSSMRTNESIFIYGPQERRDFFKTKQVRAHYIQ